MTPVYVPTSEDVRLYECAVLYPILSQKDEQQLQKEIEALFTEVAATLVSKDVWGRRGIAYPIKGQMEGCYVVYYYEMDPSKVKEIDAQLRIMKNVLRHLLVKPPKDYEIVNFAEKYEKWLKERETVDQRRSREKEEDVKEKLAKKVQMQAKRSATEKKVKTEEKPSAPLKKEELDEKLGKLISDDADSI
jgi:small subunit ribosomal protein S6